MELYPRSEARPLPPSRREFSERVETFSRLRTPLSTTIGFVARGQLTFDGEPLPDCFVGDCDCEAMSHEIETAASVGDWIFCVQRNKEDSALALGAFHDRVHHVMLALEPNLLRFASANRWLLAWLAAQIVPLLRVGQPQKEGTCGARLFTNCAPVLYSM